MNQQLKGKKIFGTDGVRGRANKSPMTVEMALELGRAAGVIFRKHNGKHRVVIGKDTRLSCYMIENALIAGLCSMGVDTLMVGPLPTPGVAFITRAYRADAGIVISASHNPYYDNGIKFFSAEGMKFSDAWEEEMETLLAKGNFEKFLPSDSAIGRNTKVHDADGRYIEFAKATFNRKLSLKNMTIALDCANGAAHRVAPLIFRELDATIYPYGISPNGLNINLNCGSLHPENLQKAVLDHQANVGIALDGDADRLIMIDEKGNTVDGDTMLAICAAAMKKKGTLRGNKIVGTVMSNLGLIKSMEKIGIQVICSNVGDRYVIQEMIDHDANLGGEQSGHLIFSDHNTTGDGLVSALQVLQVMIEEEKTLSELAAEFKKYPQTMINVKVSTKPPLESLTQVNQIIADVEKQLSDHGRVLVRYSGTENICRVMLEGPDQKTIEELAGKIADSIRETIG